MARVLIVDDDAAIRDLLSDLLAEEGYEIQGAVNGAEAIAIARSFRPHLIMMDLMLPVLDGIEAIRVLKSSPETGWIKIVAMSAGRRLQEQAHEIMADSVLGKPFDLDVVLADVAVQTRLGIAAETAVETRQAGE